MPLRPCVTRRHAFELAGDEQQGFPFVTVSINITGATQYPAVRMRIYPAARA